MAGLLPVDEALARLLDGTGPLPSERVPLAEAAGRVLSADLVALRTQPPFDASAMDGYAVRAADIADPSNQLNVIGESIAGRRFVGEVGAGQAVRIFTGAPVPPGADTILLQEDARVDEHGRIGATEATPRGRHIRRLGLDFAAGQSLLRAARVLDPAALGLAAAANHAVVPVVRRPLVAILATGSELVPPGDVPGPDQIVASNSYAAAAIVAADGGVPLDLGIVPDDADLTRQAVDRAKEAGADVLVTLGGASVGDHDLVRSVLAAAGMDLAFWKIAMRPGKPLMFGHLGAMRVLGLPGNPVSSLVCSHLFLRPLVARLGGRPFAADMRDAILGADLKANDTRQDYVRAEVLPRDVDGLIANPFATQDSSMMRTMADANGLIVRPPHAAAARTGDPCRVLMLR